MSHSVPISRVGDLRAQLLTAWQDTARQQHTVPLLCMGLRDAGVHGAVSSASTKS
jgi:hypothetical protein